MNRKVTAFVLSAALAVTLAAPAFAAAETPDVAVRPRPEPVAQTETTAGETAEMETSVLYYGQITDIGKDEEGNLTQLQLQSERYGEYVMLINSDTVWIDSGNHAASDPSDLEVGEWVYVYHSPVSTRSLPPQSQAYAVLRNMPQDVGAGQYAEIGEITDCEDGTYQLLTADGSMYLTVDGETVLTGYPDGETVQAADLQAGDRIVAWYDIALLSYPGQAYAHHVMVLPDVLSEGDQVTLELDGEASEITGRYEDGVVMVPVAAVAEALGFDVEYTPKGPNGVKARVAVESSDFRVEMTIGVREITGVTTIPDAVGMTAPQDYGKAPYVVAPGTTWAPAELFEMLGKTVTLKGSQLSIQ